MGQLKASAMVVLMAALLSVRMSAGAVYKVGDTAGWTIMGNINYGAWASSKEFHIGDTILFTYNKQFHNVMAVSKADYKACSPAKPTATWTTGNDSIVLNTTGHHYFICGFPGHCGIGQKVDIRVSKLSPSAAPSESPATAPAPSSGSEAAGGASGAAAPSPHTNGAANTSHSIGLTLAMSVLCIAAAGLKVL